MFHTLCTIDGSGSLVLISSIKEAATIAKTIRSFSIVIFLLKKQKKSIKNGHILKQINRISNISIYHFDFVLILDIDGIRLVYFDRMYFGHTEKRVLATKMINFRAFLKSTCFLTIQVLKNV